MKKCIVAITAAVIMMLGMSSCAKMTEPFKDAPRGAVNNSPADTITFPDGFSNGSTKCDHGNRLYVLYHGDSSYGAVAVVPNDPTCVSR